MIHRPQFSELISASAVLALCLVGCAWEARDGFLGCDSAEECPPEIPFCHSDMRCWRWAERLDPGVDAGPGSCRSPDGNCDVLAQDCVAPDSVCVYSRPSVDAEPQTLCAPRLGSAGGGEACCAANSCAPGFGCRGAAETSPGSGVCTATGLCRRFCCGDAANCAEGETCFFLGGPLAAGVCVPQVECDLVHQTGCSSAVACYPYEAGANCVMPTAVMAGEGENCEYANDCAPGLACFTARDVGDRCFRFCDVADGATDCPNSGGAVCQATGTLPTGVGLCPLSL